MNVLLGPTLVRQDHADAADGRAGPADDRPTDRRRRGRHRTFPCAAVPSRWSISSSSIIPRSSVYENIASPLRVAGVGRAEIDARVQRRRALAAAGQSAAALAGATVRRPAAAHRDRPRAGQARRTGAARRAAGQSRLQAARGIARGVAAHLRRRPARSWSTRRPSRPRRCCSAA